MSEHMNIELNPDFNFDFFSESYTNHDVTRNTSNNSEPIISAAALKSRNIYRVVDSLITKYRAANEDDDDDVIVGGDGAANDAIASQSSSNSRSRDLALQLKPTQNSKRKADQLEQQRARELRQLERKTNNFFEMNRVICERPNARQLKRGQTDENLDNAAEKEEEVTFKSFALHKALMMGVADADFEHPTPIQRAAIPLIMSGRDVCAAARTGSGKTAAFLLPLLNRLFNHKRMVGMTAAASSSSSGAGKRGGGLRAGRARQGRCAPLALVLSPSRELALQICEDARRLSAHCKPTLNIALIMGGLDDKTQMEQLRNSSPDLVVGTPGRIIDHLGNTRGFSLCEVQLLVLDEADRMLDEAFGEQVKEIEMHCGAPSSSSSSSGAAGVGRKRGRQTLLFSATMTQDVKELALASLHRPIKISVSTSTSNNNSNNNNAAAVNDATTTRITKTDGDDATIGENEGDATLPGISCNLVQEVVRVRQHREEEREAQLLCLVKDALESRDSDITSSSGRGGILVFMPTKWQCHRMHILMGLLRIRCGQLHGAMTQSQRLESLARFRRSASSQSTTNGNATASGGSDDVIDVLLATDLAARGLDIPELRLVINFALPSSLRQYVHRVGRTARLDRAGRAISLVAEDERALLKQIVRFTNQNNANNAAPSETAANQNQNRIKLRNMDAAAIAANQKRIRKLEETIEAILREEKEERAALATQIALEKTERDLEQRRLLGAAATSRSGNEVKRVDWFEKNALAKRRKLEQDGANSANHGDGGGDDATKGKKRRMKSDGEGGARTNSTNQNETVKPKAFSKKIKKEQQKMAAKRKLSNAPIKRGKL